MTDPFNTMVLTMNHQGMGRWSLSIPLAKKSIITLYHGTKSYQVDLSQVHRLEANSISLTPRTCRALLLPGHIKEYRVRPLSSKHYVLGPLIGILVSEIKLKKLLAGKVDPFYRWYARVLLRNKGIAVFFSPKRIAWNKNEVVGVVRVIANKQETWIEETLPIPSVIYDRCFGNHNRFQCKIIRKKCAMHSPTIKVLNAVVKLGKRRVYTLCGQISRFQDNLPKWDILRPDNIDALLEQFPIAYVKPNKLSKGKGVTKVSRTPFGFLVEQNRESKNYQHLCTSPSEVLQDLEPYISSQGFMVVQEAIPLMTFQGHPFDFRLLLQKDKSGSWKKTGVAARISGEGSIISSPRSGGFVSSYDEVMAHLSEISRKDIASSMLNLALDLAKTMDDVIGPFVELGFDLGVDINGKVKIIEVNGIPLKVSIQRLKNQKITRYAHENPIGYAIYMEGFGGQYYD